MAISWTHYQILKSLKSILPQGGSLLEIGEANWYGDVDPSECGFEANGHNPFEIAKLIYADLFAPKRIVSVDIQGTSQSLKFDLNNPIHVRGQFDVVMNHGTAEHIFNIGQVFKTMHERTNVGGLMIHEAPFTGWIDHGFYCLQPTLFFDLAAANSYRIERMVIEEIKTKVMVDVTCRDDVHLRHECRELPDNSMLFVAMTKTLDEPMKLPLQGYYNQTLSEIGKRAWECAR